MLKIIIVAFTLVLVLCVPVMGEEVGIHGELTFKYELSEFFPGQSWEMDIYYRFASWLKLGMSETTFTNNYVTYFNIIPGYIPKNQLYEAYVVFDFGQTEIKFSQWCIHSLYSGDPDAEGSGAAGFFVEGSYRF
jgi:hypothetical protein